MTQARERMAREYAEAHGLSTFVLNGVVRYLEGGGLPYAGLLHGRQVVLAAILVGHVVPSGPCPTCGGDGTVCCGRYLDSGECCAALNGGAEVMPCPDCSGSEGRDAG